ncbi:hypothetical protein ACT8ZS_32440 [Paenibacillus sp. M.A.Huq-84]
MTCGYDGKGECQIIRIGSGTNRVIAAKNTLSIVSRHSKKTKEGCFSCLNLSRWRLQKTKRLLEKGSSSNPACTSAAKPSMDFRRSVLPHARYTRSMLANVSMTALVLERFHEAIRD